MKINKKLEHDKKSKKIVTTVTYVFLAAVIISVVIFYAMYKNTEKNAPSTKTSQESNQDKNGSTATPPSQNTVKDTPPPQVDTPPPPTVDQKTNLKNVNVVITSTEIKNSQVSASGFVSNIVESGGTCTYIFTKGNETLKKTSETLENANSTTCKTVTFSSAELSSGEWTVSLSYESPSSAGKSTNTGTIIK